jgi:hypothetical protein
MEQRTPIHITLIPGRFVSRVKNRSQVEPITDEQEQTELSDILRNSGSKGQIFFWPE